MPDHDLEGAKCPDSDIDFFALGSEDMPEFVQYQEVAAAKELCFSCPVRKQCLSMALAGHNRFGVWGGLDELQLQKILSVDQYGKPKKSDPNKKCPYCISDQTVLVSTRRTSHSFRCNDCHFAWSSRVPSKSIRIEIDDEDEDLGRSFSADS